MEEAVRGNRQLDTAATGLDHAIFSLQNLIDEEPFEVLATEVIPAVEKMPAA